MFFRVMSLVAVVAMVVIGLCGCSGGDKAVTRAAGSVKMSVVWPELPTTEDRFIPRATQSLKVTLDNGAGIVVPPQIVARPADGVNSIVIFPEVPTGEYLITVLAYPTTDGTGTPQATAQAMASVTNRITTTIALDLTSTITEVTIDEYPTDITATETAQLLATARNNVGALVTVLPQPDGFMWTSSNPEIATVDQSGQVTAIAAGPVTISAMERETGVTGTVNLQINPTTGTLEIIILNGDIEVRITPTTKNMVAGSSFQFSAAVFGVPNQAVLWTVQEANGGTIVNGLYTAPNTPGTYHIVAASVANEGKTAVATVTVCHALIAYCRYDSATDNYDIYTINADGSNNTRVTNHAAMDTYPSLSSDGRRIAFASRRDGKFTIYSMNIDGTDLTRLTSTAYHSYQPVWSPDGTTIAFLSERDGGNDIYCMNADGTNIVRLTNASANYAPAFNADGTKIVYATYASGSSDIYSMNIDGSGKVNLTNNSADDAWPACSPDGTHIIFSSDRGGSTNLYRMDFDGSNVVQLTSGSFIDIEPTYNVDGSKICFASNRSATPDRDEIFIMNADGSDLMQLTNTPEGISIMPTWWL